MNAFGKCNGGGRRSSARETAPLIAVFSTLARSHDAVLVDISQTGARLSGDDLPQLGEDFILTVEGVRAVGSVVWAVDGQCGVVFDGPLPATDVESVRRKVSRFAGLTPRMKAAFDDWTAGFAR